MIGKTLLATILSVANCVCMAEPPLACNLNAISRGERPRHQQLTKLWQSAVLDRRELDDGYSFHIDRSIVSIDELAQWITLEHKCCPFFRFRLDLNEHAVDEHDNVWMTITGVAGIKAFLAAEFPVASSRRVT
jgi:hypothetical protein